MLSLLAVLLFSAVQSAVVRLSRSPQEEAEANPFWWCDPTQPGYGFYLNQGIKDWCLENAA